MGHFVNIAKSMVLKALGTASFLGFVAVAPAAYGLPKQICTAVIVDEATGAYLVETYGVGFKFVPAKVALDNCAQEADRLGLDAEDCKIITCETLSPYDDEF